MIVAKQKPAKTTVNLSIWKTCSVSIWCNKCGNWISECTCQIYTENANNKTDNVLWEFNGVTLTISQWGAKLGIKPSTLSARVQRGWSIQKALTTPLDKDKDKKCFD